MFRSKLLKIFAALILLGVLGIVVYQIPAVNNRLFWRVQVAEAYVRGVIYPADQMPTPVVSVVKITPTPTLAPTPTATEPPGITPTVTATLVPTPTLAPLPSSIKLDPPTYELEDINNCGPATLTMYLRYYGWEGDQFSINKVIKPERADRNVNVDELAYYVKNFAGWLNVEYRVGGDLDTLKHLLAAGIPVMIEETFKMDKSYWPNDDLWAGHYLLLTGYNDDNKVFISQDAFYGANRLITYSDLDKQWQSFNRVYIMVFKADQTDTIKTILGDNWDVDKNRQHALDVAKAETQTTPQNAYSWFNLGSNLVYFERYDEAAQAYDTARDIGLPQRMLRYQFGPFIAYFNTNRIDDMMALVTYALERTPNSEEALLWKGWGLYRQGDKNGAVENFRKALEVNPGYQDALYALNYLGVQP